MPASESSQPITKLSGLKRLAHILADQQIIAVDTESNSLFAYREQVCMIQFSTREADYLVDPLAIGTSLAPGPTSVPEPAPADGAPVAGATANMPDLALLGPIFANPEIEKTFHAAEYDLICLKRDFGFGFNSLFDTMLAARILGRKEVGLGSILEAEFNIQVDKRHQRANWGQRPLPGYLLDYARQDTHYLIAVREKLAQQLEERGLMALAQEDFRRLCKVEANHENGKTACWKVNGAHLLSPQQAAVLQELCKYRDDAARQMNRPLFKVISDHSLHAIASSLPESLDELKTLPGMTQHQVNRHGKALLQAVQRGLQAKPIHRPHNMRPDDRYMRRIEALKQWRKEKARELEVESDIILPRDLLGCLALKNPAETAELAECLQDVPWRQERYGEEILMVLKRVGKL